MSDEAHPFDPAATWKHVRELVCLILNLFGAPADIVKGQYLPRRLRTQMLHWLTSVEALVRRILLIQASALPKPNAPKSFAPHSAGGVHGRGGFASENSEDWSVSFRMSDRRLLNRKTAKPAASRRPPNLSARPLAERLEALIRVCHDPEKFAQRLARRLHAKPFAAQRIAHPIARTKHTNPAYSLLLIAQPLALAAAARFADSS